MSAYDHKKVEKKWQAHWDATRAFAADDTSSKEKLYILDMFPYPSGSGLHVGHVEGYTATDIYSRYKRMQGFNVLHPMGWDAFGLPAENYAIKTGVAPAQTTNEAIETFRGQIKALGLSYDWDREIGAHRPDYYRWTQWFFLFLYKNGLAEKRLAKVNWCPKDQTVLANEQTVSEAGEKGVCFRCGTKVIQKDLEQWFFKITNYADALVDDLDTVDWPESTKVAQRNWIGRSEGAEIEFAIADSAEKIKVFTTRADTLFGATFLVLAPEHGWLSEELAKSAPAILNKDEVEAYIESAKNKTEIERATEGREKTGIELRGIKAINPANNAEIPVFVADYVLGGYGTGAIMAVPAHDERDGQFAKQFNLPIVEVLDVPADAVRPYTGESTLNNSAQFDGMTSADAKKKITDFVGGEFMKTYRLRDWLISRQRYWGAPIPVVYDPEGKPHPIPEEHLPWLLPTDVEYLPKGTSPLATSKELLERTEKIFGKGWTPEVDTMDTFVCSSWYYFRFADPHNDKEFASKAMLKKWLPVDLYVGGAEHTVLHLMYARFFTKALHTHGLVDFIEPFSKLRHQGIILAEDSSKMSKSKGNVINPDDVIERYGADTLRMYEMFMGPLEAMKPWSTQNIMGIRRFLERVWQLQEKLTDTAENTEIEQLLHQTIKKVGDDIDGLKLNTAISALMILANHMQDQKAVAKGHYTTYVALLAPFAPHMAHELIERIGMGQEALQQWPAYDAAKAALQMVTIAVQVNGKARGMVTLPVDAGEAEALQAARAEAGVAKWLSEGKERKAVYVPGKIVNFVVEK